MTFHENYLNQVELLLKVLPIVNQQECFALKGGTAINLFIRNMPRLSVDIDLAYLPIEPRDIFLQNITLALNKLSDDIKSQGQGNFQIKEIYTKESKQLSKLLVYSGDTNIKIEPNLVLRGSVFSCQINELCQGAQDQFLQFTRVKTLSFADIYGGKICAALSRQHPRDLFDVKLLLENEGMTDQLRQAFLIYLASSPRPIHELLNPEPNLKDFPQAFEDEFLGMTKLAVSCEELIEVRLRLIKQILQSLTVDERQFLLSLKLGEPDWSALPVPGIETLPAIQWKLLNIRKMDEEKRKNAYEKLREVLQFD